MLIPTSGSVARTMEKKYPIIMIMVALRRLRRLTRKIALVIANHRSMVMIVRVKIESWEAKTVRKPARRHPKPKGSKFNYLSDFMMEISDLPYCQR